MCIQQCLAREPLLAIALSTSKCHRLKVEKFRKGVHASFRDSLPGMTLGAMNGELFELIVFVALQQANGSGIKERNTIGGFITSLVGYLSPHETNELSLIENSDENEGWNFGKVYQKEKRGKSLMFRKETEVNSTDTYVSLVRK
jgi:hypothetical protein